MPGLPAMTKEVTEIEVEVLEIDGIAPVVAQERAAESPPQQHQGDWQDWRQWQGRVRRLDSRWWPLWLFLGIVALGLALTVGLVVAVVFVILRVFLKIVRAVLG
jgi:hypothetical protein